MHYVRPRGFSQEAFALACDFHRTYIGSGERGKCNIPVENMERIATTLNVNPRICSGKTNSSAKKNVPSLI